MRNVITPSPLDVPLVHQLKPVDWQTDQHEVDQMGCYQSQGDRNPTVKEQPRQPAEPNAPGLDIQAVQKQGTAEIFHGAPKQNPHQNEHKHAPAKSKQGEPGPCSEADVGQVATVLLHLGDELGELGIVQGCLIWMLSQVSHVSRTKISPSRNSAEMRDVQTVFNHRPEPLRTINRPLTLLTSSTQQ